MEKNYKILLVDDIPEYVDTMDLNLPDDCLAMAAYTAEDARVVIVNDSPDMAVLDVRLNKNDAENRDGLDLLAWIKKNRPEMPVIMISAYREFEFEAESLALGAECFLRKPVQPEEFRITVERILTAKEGR